MSCRTAAVPSTFRWIGLLAFAGLAAAATLSGQGRKPITFEDLMRFKAIRTPAVSEDGRVLAYAAQPDRGDGEGVVHELAGGRVFKIPRGSSPAISGDSRFVAMAVRPPFEEAESAKTPPKPSMALLDVRSGAVASFDRVDRFAFSADGKWLAYLLSAPPAE